MLGVELDKSWKVQCSDWEAQTLSEKQVCVIISVQVEKQLKSTVGII